MPRFVPIIYEDEDGTQVFRNDLVDIEFTIDGLLVTKRFDLGDAAAPPIPFPVVGSFTYKDKSRNFVIDSTGTAWVENIHNSRNFSMLASNVLLLILVNTDSPHFEAALAFVKKERKDYEQYE